MDPIVWATLLMILGFALVILEIFIPSGGILGFLAVCSILVSVGSAFVYRDAATGFTFVLIAVVGFPAAVAAAFRWWPNTMVGRRMLLHVPAEADILPEDDPREEIRELIGEIGSANSDMFPGGTVVVKGKTYEAVSEGMPIDKGQSVEVVDVQNNRLVIRASEADPPPEAVDDVLSKPIDTVGLDPFEDPLA